MGKKWNVKLREVTKAIWKNAVDRAAYIVVTAFIAFVTFFVGRVSQIYSTYDGLPYRVSAVEVITENSVSDRAQIHRELNTIITDIDQLKEDMKDNKTSHGSIEKKTDDIYKLVLKLVR